MTYALGGYDTSPPLPELQGRHLGTAAQAGPVADTVSADGLLALDDVSLSFGGVAALANIDLSVRRGEIRAIIGPNGAGKSSRVNVISGVYRRDRGHIQIGGKRYGNVPTEKLARLGIAARFSRKDLNHGFHHRRSWPLPHISALACTSSPPCRGLFRRPVRRFQLSL
ncbi:ATP-binding cassette domain-containing protein [Rhizobium sp. BR 317]|uniref:ATP-binding cassette domain-containing protein n=1 Tax=Rhizobium sp. BR 317 TaxID=3040015 RepID=UPI0039BEFB3C